MASVIRGSGTSSLGGDLDVEGVLTYEDVSSVDSVGIITARSGIDVGTGTSIFSPSSNVLTLGTNSEERLRITSGGGVLIGGHTSAVDVGNAPNIEIVNTSTSTLTLARNDTSIASGNDIAAIRVWGNDSNGTYQQCAEILAEADGDHGTDDKPTALAFKVTADGQSSVTERLRLTSGGNLGIGTISPSNMLHIEGSSPSIRMKMSDGPRHMISPYGADLYIEADNDNTSTNTNIIFQVDGSECARFDSNQNLKFPNGQGIDFSTTAGSGMETGGGVLDDYEEGTWTPTSETGTINYTSAKYTKIGNIVHLNVYIDTWSNITSDAVVQIQSLPYAGENTDANVGCVMYRYIDDTDGIGGDMAVFMSGGNSLRFYFQNSDGDSNYSALKHKDINGTSSSFRVQMTYRVA